MIQISPDSRVLALSPHTDDSEIGAGGLIAAMAKMTGADSQVKIVPFSCGSALPSEAEAASRTLGLAYLTTDSLRFEANRFPRDRDSIIREMLHWKKGFDPTLVLVPSTTDIHQDHQTITQEAIRAFRDSTILGYEVPYSNPHFRPDVYMPLHYTFIKKKQDALAEYHSQEDRHSFQILDVYSLARTRGAQCGHDLAEAFEAIRIHIS